MMTLQNYLLRRRSHLRCLKHMILVSLNMVVVDAWGMVSLTKELIVFVVGIYELEDTIKHLNSKIATFRENVSFL